MSCSLWIQDAALLYRSPGGSEGDLPVADLLSSIHAQVGSHAHRQDWQDKSLGEVQQDQASTSEYDLLIHPECQISPTLQMKGRWEFNINVWFPFMYSQKWNCYFQRRIIMFCLPVPTPVYL